MGSEVREQLPTEGELLPFLSERDDFSSLRVTDRDGVLCLRRGQRLAMLPMVLLLPVVIAGVLMWTSEWPWQWIALGGAALAAWLVVCFLGARVASARLAAAPVCLRWDRRKQVLELPGQQVSIPLADVRMICGVTGWGTFIQSLDGFGETHLRRHGNFGELSVVADLAGVPTRLLVANGSPGQIRALAKQLSRELDVPLLLTRPAPLED